MNLSFWESTQGIKLLELAQAIAKEVNYDMAKLSLKLFEQQGDISGDFVRQAAEIIYLRNKIKNWGEWTSKIFFTTSTLEQASQPEIAKHHAKRFKGLHSVLEICTGSGCDTMALSKNVADVTTIESDPHIADLASLNFSSQGIENIKLEIGKAEELLKTIDISKFSGVFADPSRRTLDGRRIYNPEQYKPPLSLIFSLNFEGIIGIKVSPGYNFDILPSGWAREWIGYKDECREQVLWKNSELLDGSVSLVDQGIEWRPPEDNGFKTPIKEIKEGDFIIEPHPALIRSGKMHLFYQEKGISLLDYKIAYGVSSKEPEKTAFYEIFKVNQVMPYDLNKLRSRVKELKWNTRSEIKKRGVDQDPDALRKKLKFSKPDQSENFGVIILVRIGEGHKAILGERI